MFVKKNKSLRIPGVPQSSLSRKQKDELFTHILRLSRVFDEAIRRLDSEIHLKQANTKYGVLLTACRQVAEKHNAKAGAPSFRKRVTAQVKDIVAAMKDQILPEEKQSLLGEKGLLARAFSAAAGSINEQYGLDLLKRFLTEAEVFGPLADAFAQCKNNQQKLANIGQMLAEAQRRLGTISSLDLPAIKTTGEEWAEHEKRLLRYRGQKTIGLRTGLEELDRRTRGLRGVFIFGAKPGTGKTALAAVQVPLGICRHYADNNAVVIVISLDMDRFELYNRVQCNLSNVEWSVLTFGSPVEDREIGEDFSKVHLKRLESGGKRLKKEQVDRRLVILDRTILGDDITAGRLTAIVEAVKARCKAKRALLVIDYLQLLPVPDDVANRGDLTADKYRVAIVQNAIAGTRSTDNPLGDTVLAISEVRKPASAKDLWGQSLAELIGSVRLPYAADGVLLYRPMTAAELQFYYDWPMTTNDSASKLQQQLADEGIAPIMLILDKGRDGMIRGQWGIEFHFKTSRFRELLKEGDGTKPKTNVNELVQAQNAALEAAYKGQSKPEGSGIVLPPASLGIQAKSKNGSVACNGGPAKTAKNAKGSQPPKDVKKKNK